MDNQENKVPVLLATEEEVVAHVVPDRSAGPLHFRIMDVIEPAEPEGLPLMPFFRLHERRYQMYWQLTNAERIAAKKEKLASEERARAAREAATLDSVAVGEQQPEDDRGREFDISVNDLQYFIARFFAGNPAAWKLVWP